MIRKIMTAMQYLHLPNRTIIKLDCGHERSLGGHVLEGKIMSNHHMIGRNYECLDGHCNNGKMK